MSYGGPQAQIAIPPFTKMVKILVITNLVSWVGLIMILQGILGGTPIFDWFGLVPHKLINQFAIWQIFTYMFLHASSVFHVVFNMLILWMFGSELEQRWGSRWFLAYYLSCGVGAAILYTGAVLIYYLITQDVLPLMVPVVGASGAAFGLILAYGILFGERVVYFMMVFPMKAKYFALILGGVEVLTLMNSGLSGQVANLAHLGGLVSGFLFLTIWSRWRASGGGDGRSSQKRGRKLKLVVNNERTNAEEPKYWN
jgi:membrane associated rhomboid family serine protease